ncbi:glutathione S- transferase, nitrogen catabolite repression regulator [Didymosphaeria variabile]|uniref:Glutathione S- transferase, nitrogen catabolite repression regulator n=1 Tax=Didymosphaeria variabile TaxID=1932322 RepID=A0A9W8XSE5_9PLEO|nr:glutathione S- transferase, nitrogen catabolite repression regulator [Didymosphaeria variabile]KAJ4356523.1 glutathione S- transferase, nitrogen catabolite repression regulator [Didymosphaeria variabile]
MSIQSIELWGHWGAPNPWKVCMILEELQLPYKIHYKEFTDTKTEDYLEINPNGRLPTIKDPNSGLTLWESGAIIQYLVDRYDTEGKISCKSFPEKYLTQQWLAFQISGQGPYFGQATWFARFHAEKIPSAIDRYVNEIFRVTGVLDKALKANSTGWLVGDKVTYADLSFITWSSVAEGLVKQLGKWEGFEERFPTYTGWLAAMRRLDSVKKVEEQMAKGRAANGL